MLALVLEVLSLVTIPLGALALAAMLVVLLAERRWLPTTAYLEDGVPPKLHWISDDGEVGTHKLTQGDPLMPRRSDQRTVYYCEDDPSRIRLHRRGELVRVLRLSGLLVAGFGVVCAIASTVLSLIG